MVRDVEVQGWISTDSHDFTFFLSNGSSLSINIKEILLLPSAFLHKVFELRSLIFNVNSLESQEMIKIIKASLYTEESGSDSDLSILSSPTVRLNTEEESKRRDEEKMKEAWKEVTAKAEISTASTTPTVVVHEAEAEASNKDKGKGLMTKEDEERIEKEKKEKEDRRRRREEEEMAELKKAQDRLTAILLREQQIHLYAKQLDDLKVKIPAVYQIEEDEALALQLQEQFDREEEEIQKKKKKKEAKFRITDSELAKEMSEEWVKALISQGEDVDYLEKLSNKKIYRACMSQQGQLANKKKVEEEEKAKQKSKKTIAFNRRSHEERKIMIDFLKARGESGKRLGPMNFMNLQALYLKVKKDEEERLEKKGSKKRVLQLPDSDLRRMMKLGEVNEPMNEGGRHLLLTIKHHFNHSRDEILDVKPIQSHSPFISWSYNAEKDEFTLTDVKGQKMRCSSKAIFKMANKDIKTLSELPRNNPSKDQRGYEVERIASHMKKLQQQKQ
ncbi:hypothetical protein L1987_40889 [Smallanthus sonchifolius]|uniref:Uncharacterized protein n=1 Tax=Smallanthus sonchifolius TaxID=185202 RepID=A0ACB9GTT0_9ASTR|nr:hypothetical protein L1987_40889 [Smallanthus sonchifolius]